MIENFAKGLRCRGTVEGVDLKTGEVVFKKKNMFVQAGLNEIAKMVAGQEGAVPAYIAVGTSNTEPTSADTTLKGTELGRKAFEDVEITDSSIKYSASFLAGEASGAWEETGMFSASTGGVMWSRAVTGTYTKIDKDEIKVFWTYEFEDASSTQSPS